MALVQSTRVLSLVAYKMAFASAAQFIHKDNIFSVKKRKTLTAAIMHGQGRHVVDIT
jgi:hypothetical protein